jgi:hypothetical protein
MRRRTNTKVNWFILVSSTQLWVVAILPIRLHGMVVSMGDLSSVPSQDAVRDSEKITISISEASLICVVYLVGPLADSTDFTVENLPCCSSMFVQFLTGCSTPRTSWGNYRIYQSIVFANGWPDTVFCFLQP